MISDKRTLILRELVEGTGAAMDAVVAHTGLRSGIRIWFGDLDEKHGPLAELHPFGLKGYRVTLSFGIFSGAVLAQIAQASAEDVQLARALVESIKRDVDIEISGQSLNEWSVKNGSFRMIATIRNREAPLNDAVVLEICRDVIVPMMGAMAELIGYDVIDEKVDDETPAVEGAILQSTIRRRERNPRNRLLCIRIHGEKCIVCGTEPRRAYGTAGGIIEVHHLEPLAVLDVPRPYDPRSDLVPLCPSCHRAIHTRGSTPLTVPELKGLMEAARHG